VIQLRRKKFVFCASPGRSGTHYLSQLFNLGTEVCSVHEPEHQYSQFSQLKPYNWNLKQALFGNSYTLRQQLKFKQINDLLDASRAEVYVETNPLFCTLWHDELLKDSSQHDVTVIILRRPVVDILKSILDLGWYSDRNGDEWMVSGYSINSLFVPPMKESVAIPMDRVIGYLFNVALYTQNIIQLCEFHGHKVIDVKSNDLFSD
jgi:hypothetical protein